MLKKKQYAVVTFVTALLMGVSLFGSSYADAATSAFHTPIHTNNQRFFSHKKHHFFPIFKETASILNMDIQSLKKSLKQGKSLTEIAQSKGISEKVLKQKLMTLREQKVNTALSQGEITQTEAKRIKSHMSEHLDFMLNNKHLWGRHQHWRMKKRFGHQPFHPSPEVMARIIGISKEQFIAKIKSGKTITEIAKEKGISKQQMVVKIKQELTPMIENQLDRKWIDSKS